MKGTLINIATILVGGSLGMAFGARLPERIRQTVIAGLGLFTLVMGVRMFFDSQNALIVVASLLVGGLLGEWWRIEDGLAAIGRRLEERFVSGAEQAARGQQFVPGFLTSSLLFCVGPMTILGSIQDGLTGDFNLLAIKSVLDGFAALAFASTLGLGVLFSVLVVLVYQGGLTLLAAQAQAILSDPMVAEMRAVGGVLLVGLAIGSLLELRAIRTGNLLPALVIAPLIVAALAALGLG